MTSPDRPEPPTVNPLTLTVWRRSESEQRFIEAWTRVLEKIRAARRPAALFHAASDFSLRRTGHFYERVRQAPVEPRAVPLSGEDARARLIQFELWGFFQSAKSVLDAVSREVNVVYWHLDRERQFYDPLLQARQTSFYMVRQKLLRSDVFRHDRVSQLLRRRTTGETADGEYRALSHLANLSLLVPLPIGPIAPARQTTRTTLPLSRCRVVLPDDPRQTDLTYERGFEVNKTGREILQWLEEFLDRVYDHLVPSIDRLKES